MRRQAAMWKRTQPRALFFLTSTVAAVGASAGAVTAAAAAAGVDVRVGAERFGSGWATKFHRRLATTSSEATCDGILSGSTCCSAACGECGGSDCSSRGDGTEECCTEAILESGILCSDTGRVPPCIVDGDPEPPSPGPDATPAPEASGETPPPETAETPPPVARDTPSPSTPEIPDTVPPTPPGTNAPVTAVASTPAPIPVEPPTPPPVIPTPTPVVVPPVLATSTPATPAPEERTPETVAPVPTPAPLTVGPAPTAVPSPGLTAMPTSGRTAPPSPAPSAASSASPTTIARATRSPPPTVAPTTLAGEAPGFLGSGFVYGSFSADGISDDLLASLGEEGVCRQVVCGLDPCPAGAESVLVGDEAAARSFRRVLLLLTAHSQSEGLTSDRQRRRDPYHSAGQGHGGKRQQHAVRGGEGGGFLRGQGRAWPSEDEEGVSGRMQLRRRGSGRRRRRLAVIEDVEFLMPSEGGIEGEDGEVMTGSQQAAAFVNNMADVAVLAGIAADLGVGVEDLGFADLAFDQGSEAPIRKEFDVGYVQSSSSFRVSGDDDGGPGRVGTWILAVLLVAPVALAVACFCWRYHSERVDRHKARILLDRHNARVLLARLDKPTPKRNGVSPASSVVTCEKKLGSFDEEDGGAPGDARVSEGEVGCEFDAASLLARGDGSGGSSPFSSRHVRSEGVAPKDRRHGKNLTVPRTESMDASDVKQQQERRRRQQQHSGGTDEFSTESMESFDPQQQPQPQQQQRYEGADDCAQSGSDDRSLTDGQMKAPSQLNQFTHRRGASWKREASNGRSFCDLAQHYCNSSRDSSSEAPSPRMACGNKVLNPMFDRASTQPRLRESEDEPRDQSPGESVPKSGSPQAKPEAGAATRAAPSHGRSFSEGARPSSVAGGDPRGRDEADMTPAGFSSGARQQGLVRGSFLQLLLERTSGRGQSDANAAHSDGQRKGRPRARGVPGGLQERSENGCDSDPTSGDGPDAPLECSDSTGDRHAASDRTSAGGRDDGGSATATSAAAGVSSRSGGSSPLKLTRPVHPVRGGGGSALSGGPSRELEPRSASSSPCRRGYWKREAVSSLDSSFSDEEDRLHGSRGSVDSGSQERGQRIGSPAEISLASKEPREEGHRDSDCDCTSRPAWRLSRTLSVSFDRDSPNTQDHRMASSPR